MPDHLLERFNTMATDHLSMFDKLNLAQCAKLRACDALMDNDRFYGEYETTRLWMKHKVVSVTGYTFVDRY